MSEEKTDPPSAKQLQLESLCKLAGYEVERIEYVNKSSLGFPAGWHLWTTDEENVLLGTKFTDAQAFLLSKAQDSGNVEISYQFEEMEPIAQEGPDVEVVEFNDEQADAYAEILECVQESKGMFCLKGFAGTGKTTIMTELSRRNPDLKLAFTAPTNKAVKVLKTKIYNHKCLTIHQLLNLKLKKEKGVEQLVSMGSPALRDYDAIIIDEASMLNRELLEDHLARNAEYTDASLIFVGDPKQLPPVNEPDSLAFHLDCDEATLENIVRQAEDNPILQNTKRLRRMQFWDPDRLLIENDINAETGCIKVRPSEFIPFVKEQFASEAFAKNHDYIRYLAWTNDKVGQVNRTIHNELYGETACPYSVGERIMARAPIMDGEIKNSEECIVQSIDETDNWVGFPAWKLLILSETGVLAEVHVVKEEAIGDFNEFKKKCVKAKEWREFYEVTESFADIQHAYSMTVHKSQGSTFDNVIIDIKDIMKNHDSPKELMSLLYVAFSRPRYRAFMRM